MVMTAHRPEPKAPVVTSMRDRVGPLLEKMPGMRLYEEAKNAGFPTLSAFLEAEDPSDPDERRQGFDAFTRLLMVADVKTVSDRFGAYHADPLEKLGRDEAGRAIFPELVRRWWQGASAERRAAQQRAQTQFFSNEFAAGSIQAPYDDDTTLRQMQIEPAIPLTEVIARTRLNDGPDYRARYLTEPAAADVRMLRVAEGAELPGAKITEGARAIKLYKFGRKLEATYEALRRLRLDDFAVYVRRLGIQTEVDQVSAAVDVMINGDGNASTAATVYNLTALDPATTANNLTIAAWLAFTNKWLNPYMMTAVLGREAAILKLLLLNIGTANTLVAAATMPGGLRQTFTPINTRLADARRYGITNDAPANQLVGFDGRFAIEHVVERGSDISEAERWITRQTEELTFSFNEAYAVFDANSVKVLNLAA